MLKRGAFLTYFSVKPIV